MFTKLQTSVESFKRTQNQIVSTSAPPKKKQVDLIEFFEPPGDEGLTDSPYETVEIRPSLAATGGLFCEKFGLER